MSVKALQIESSNPLAGGVSFGEVGPYDQLEGTVHFAADPEHPANGLITDLELAPRDSGGMVICSADFTILTPRDPGRGNHRILLDILNRGNRVALRYFNTAAPAAYPSAPLDPGNGFLMRQGYTVVWCGWQHDVPLVEGLLSIRVPDADGPISGKIAVSFQPNSPSQVNSLSDRVHQPYRASDLNDPEATLTVGDGEDAQSHPVPRDRWSFARLDGGRVVPDASHIYMASGFMPGKFYEVVYTTTGAPVVGLGLLATRDLVSFLRYAGASEGNPCAGDIQYAYGFGASQSGRFLRQFLHLGLNEDEAERMVFDGLIPHIAGARRGEFNQRFGQPSSMRRRSIGCLFPFADTVQTDPETGRAGGLLSRLEARGKTPRVFLTNSSAEYWRGDASLVHVDTGGTRDIAAGESVRIYHFAGTQHGSGVLPLTDTNPLDGSRGQQPFNSVDYTPLLRAALTRLDRWVSAEEVPPPSKHPRIDNGSAVRPSELAGAFGAIPEVNFPAHPPHLSRLDLGPDADAGKASTLPAIAGKAYANLVSGVDQDGNETAGVALPDVSVPLATYTGWNLRHPDMGAPEQIMGLTGSTIPFLPTRAEREASGDPRRSIEERYDSGDAYLGQVRRAARALVDEGYLLSEDLEGVVEQASRRYDLFTSGVKAHQAADD